MKKFATLLFLFNALLMSNDCIGQKTNSDNNYSFKRGDSNGIGKWYMGREIAYVMGFQGIGWLERSDREKEENVSNLIEATEKREVVTVEPEISQNRDEVTYKIPIEAGYGITEFIEYGGPSLKIKSQK